MKRGARLVWLVGAAMLLSAWLGVALKPRPGARPDRPPLAAVIPDDFGAWRAEPQAPASLVTGMDEGAGRDYTEVLVRTYRNAAGERVMLTIAYGREQRADLKAHRPEFCYRGQGFDIAPAADGVLSTRFGTIPVRRLVARSWQRIEPITYWMTVGDEVRLPGLGRHLAMFRHNLAGEVADGMLVRVSSLGDNAAGAWDLQARFVAALVEGLPKRDRARLVGLSVRP